MIILFFKDRSGGKVWIIRFLTMFLILIFSFHDTAYCATSISSVDALYDICDVSDESITFDILGIVGEYGVDEETEELIKGYLLNGFYFYSDSNFLVLCVNEIYDSHPGYSYAGDGKVVIRNYYIFECMDACSYNFGIKDGYYYINFDRMPCEFMANMQFFALVYFESGYAIQEYDSGSQYYMNMVSTPDTQFTLAPTGGTGYDVECEYDFSVLYRDSSYTFDSSLTDIDNSGGTDTGDSGSSDTSDTGDASNSGSSSTGSSNSGGTSSSNTGSSSTGSSSGTSDTSSSDVADTDNSTLAEAGEKISGVFPFCIPFDIYKALKSMRSAAVAPAWETEIEFPSINYTYQFRVDMAEYEDVIYILRWGIFLLFVAGLIAGTYKMIKWKRG